MHRRRHRGRLQSSARAHSALIAAFVASPAFERHHDDLFHALDRTTARLTDLTVAACDRFVALVGADAGDIRTKGAASSYMVSRLLVRTYGQLGTPEERTACLDVMEGMMRLGAYGLDEAIADYEQYER